MKMDKPITLLLLLLMVGTISIVFFACGDDDDDDAASVGDDDSGDDDDDDDDNNDDDIIPDDDDDDVDLVMGGVIIDPATSENVSNVTVTLLDDTTGDPIEPELSTTSDEDGEFEIDVPSNYNTIGLQLVKDGYYHTYYYHIKTAPDATVYIYPSEPINEVFDFLGVTYDTQKGILMGKVLWQNEQSAGEIVGCAEVTAQPTSGAIYYFNAEGEPDTTRTSTDPENADFLGVNVDVGAAIFTATVDSLSVGNTIPKIRANSVTDVSMIFSTDDSTTNPTPEDCE